MLASEAIAELTDLINKHGDLRVCDELNRSFDEFEYCADDGIPAFVFGLNNSDNE